METEILQGLMLPFVGTALGSACVFFIRGNLHWKVERSFTGFAAGVMVAAAVWSLLIPAMEQSAHLGGFAFLPAVIGFWAGILFLLFLDHIIPHIHRESNQSEGPDSTLSRTAKLVLAVTLHNIPEGMAVGVVYAGLLSSGLRPGCDGISGASALALSLGIAIQNFPEGAIISLPLRAEGVTDRNAFLYGVLSGIVEPVGGYLTILAVSYVVPFLPYFFSFAAGAMLYVVVEELIPEMSQGRHSNIGTIMFAAGFSLRNYNDATGKYLYIADNHGKKLHMYLIDCPKGYEVDHINLDTLDNRSCNLRIVTHQQNQINQEFPYNL